MSKHTGEQAASNASSVLTDGRTGDDSKSAAGSALSQADESSEKSTGDSAAQSASEVLQDDSTSTKSKSAAGSALSQTEND